MYVCLMGPENLIYISSFYISFDIIITNSTHLELLYSVLIDGVDHVENLVSPLLDSLNKSRVLNLLTALTSDVVDGLLSLLHLLDVLLEGDLLLTALGGAESKEISNLVSVGTVLVDTELEVLGELLVELLVVLLVVLDLSEHVEALLDDVLSDDLEDLVLLEGLTRDVEWEILRVDNTLNEGEPLWDDLLTVVHDEHSSDIEFDVVLLLLGLEKIEWGSLWNEEESSELESSLKIEVLDSQVIFPIVGKSLVEASILLLGDIFLLSHPDWLDLVKGLHLLGHLLDLLLFLLLLLVVLDFLDLGLVILTLLLVFLVLLLVLLIVIGVSHFLFGGLLNLELNWERDELGVLLDQVLQTALLQILRHILLQFEDDLGSSGECLAIIWADGESTSSIGFPSVLAVIVVLGDDGDFLGDQILVWESLILAGKEVTILSSSHSTA